MCWCKDICSLKGGKDHKIFCLLTNRKIFRGIKKNTIKNIAEYYFQRGTKTFIYYQEKYYSRKMKVLFWLDEPWLWIKQTLH